MKREAPEAWLVEHAIAEAQLYVAKETSLRFPCQAFWPRMPGLVLQYMTCAFKLSAGGFRPRSHTLCSAVGAFCSIGCFS